MKLSDFKYDYIEHHLKHFSVNNYECVVMATLLLTNT